MKNSASFLFLFSGRQAELILVKIAKRKNKEEDEEFLAEENGEAEEDKEEETGVEISVSHPKKRISSLEMLSGGERSLVAISLLFAMSQVNPPPFLILDETDAALDEANSQKYALMLKSLGEKTQLVVITITGDDAPSRYYLRHHYGRGRNFPPAFHKI